MAQLDSSGAVIQRSFSPTSESFASSSAMQSPLSPSHVIDANMFSEVDSVANKDIEDWIAKAKQSFQEFDEFIGIRGAGMPKSYLVEDENLEGSSDEDYINVSGEDFEIAVENPDGKEVIGNGECTLHHKSSTSSLSTNGTGVLVKGRKHAIENAKLATLPVEQAPWGLFGQMSLETTPAQGENNGGAEEDEDKPSGIAGKNFFRSSGLSPCCLLRRHYSLIC